MNISGFGFGERQSICEAYMKVVREAEDDGEEEVEKNDVTAASEDVLKKMEDQGMVDTEDDEDKDNEETVSDNTDAVDNATDTSTETINNNTTVKTDTTTDTNTDTVKDTDDKVDAETSNDYQRVKDTVKNTSKDTVKDTEKTTDNNTVSTTDNRDDDTDNDSDNDSIDKDIADEVNSSELVADAKENPEPYLSAEGIESMKNGDVDMDELNAHPERFLSTAGMKLVMDVIRSRGGKNR